MGFVVLGSPSVKSNILGTASDSISSSFKFTGGLSLVKFFGLSGTGVTSVNSIPFHLLSLSLADSQIMQW